jgi:cysteinyl-tRNA synthetase
VQILLQETKPVFRLIFRTEIFLFNTLERKKTQLVPINPERITMYVCGPTVYNRAHIGNMRPAIVFDVLFRLLRYIYGEDHVIYARNITDVDDKINAAAIAEGVDISVITQKYTEVYHQDIQSLNVLLPTIEPRATAHIGEIIALIGKLIDEGHAYQAEDGVYFHVPSMKNYGRLSGRNLEDMQAGARIEIDEKKKNPADFALWKAAKPNEVSWAAPFGAGRPGWHIECSAMIEKNLGQTIDIHGGGHDLIFPHHENEIAQSECAHGGETLANIWLHNGFLNFGSEKMSKSLGNVLNIAEITATFKPEAVRLAMLSAHYRAPLDWNDDLILQSTKTLDRLYRALENVWAEGVAAIMPKGLLDALCDDLNTPQALAVLSELVKNANKAQNEDEKRQALAELKGVGALLGILQLTPDEWFNDKPQDDDLNARIDALVNERTIARAEKNWGRADEIRKELGDLNVEVKDSADGPTWRFL